MEVSWEVGFWTLVNVVKILFLIYFDIVTLMDSFWMVFFQLNKWSLGIFLISLNVIIVICFNCFYKICYVLSVSSGNLVVNPIVNILFVCIKTVVNPNFIVNPPENIMFCLYVKCQNLMQDSLEIVWPNLTEVFLL